MKKISRLTGVLLSVNDKDDDKVHRVNTKLVFSNGPMTEMPTYEHKTYEITCIDKMKGLQHNCTCHICTVLQKYIYILKKMLRYIDIIYEGIMIHASKCDPENIQN